MSNDKITAAAREPYDERGPIDAPNPPAARATLADVKPGGMVRLGDQAERARFEAWPQAREFEIQKDGSGEYLSEVTHGAWLAWKYLSAQPSPPHQIDAETLWWLQDAINAMAEGGNQSHIRFLQRLHDSLSAQPSPGGQGDASRLLAAYLGEPHPDLNPEHEISIQTAINAIAYALAARQPVGENPAWRDELVREAYNRGLADGLNADRQPVGEPVAEAIEQLADDVESCVSDACGYLASDSGWDDYGIYRDDAAARYRALPDRIRALATPTAQAVDLGAVREAVRKAWQKCAAGESVDLQFGTLLALIDSQAVGK